MRSGFMPRILAIPITSRLVVRYASTTIHKLTENATSLSAMNQWSPANSFPVTAANPPRPRNALHGGNQPLRITLRWTDRDIEGATEAAG
jgi:hypothetical protein